MFDRALQKINATFSCKVIITCFIQIIWAIIIILSGQSTVAHTTSAMDIYASTENAVTTSVNGIVISNTYVYVGAGARIKIVDISNPTAPIQIGQTGLFSETVSDITLQGNYLYAGHLAGDVVNKGREGVSVTNISTPTAPTLVSFFDAPGVTRIAVAAGYAYIGVLGQGLHILDLSDPNVLTEVGAYTATSTISGIAIQGNYAYVTDGDLHILDISNPANLVKIGFLSNGIYRDVVVRDHYAYIAAADAGLQVTGSLLVVDVANPASPTVVGGYATGTYTSQLYIKESFAYLVDEIYGGLFLINISVPAAPTQTAVFSMSDPAKGVIAFQNYVCVVSEPGLNIVDVSIPTAPKLAGLWFSTINARLFLPLVTNASTGFAK